MTHIELSEATFRLATDRAAARGFPSVGDYVEDALLADEEVTDADIQRLFTPERLAELDKAVAQVKAGRGMTMAEVEAALDQTAAEWKAAHCR